MSRKGCSPDNAACEGFFEHLENEMFYLRDWKSTTIEVFIRAVHEYKLANLQEHARPKNEAQGLLIGLCQRRPLIASGLTKLGCLALALHQLDVLLPVKDGSPTARKSGVAGHYRIQRGHLHKLGSSLSRR